MTKFKEVDARLEGINWFAKLANLLDEATKTVKDDQKLSEGIAGTASEALIIEFDKLNRKET